MKVLFNNRKPNLPRMALNLRFSVPWRRIGYSIVEFIFKIFKLSTLETSYCKVAVLGFKRVYLLRVYFLVELQPVLFIDVPNIKLELRSLIVFMNKYSK